MKYKVIKEYERFYLAESPKGYKETFNKDEYKLDSEGYINKRVFDSTNMGTSHPPINTPWKGQRITEIS